MIFSVKVNLFKSQDVDLKISNEGTDGYWFCLHTPDGGTTNRPYGFVDKSTLEQLRDKINRLLKE